MSLTTQFDPALKEAYDSNIRDLCQQSASKVAGLFEQATMEGESKGFDQFEPFEFSAAVSKYGRTTPEQVQMKQRIVYASKHKTKKVYDNLDKLNTMRDLNAPITRNMVNGVHRLWDKVMIEALLGNATVKINNASTVSTETMAAANYVAMGSTGLTLEKLITAAAFLDANDVPDDEKRYLIAHPNVITNFLNRDEVQTFDSNAVKALVAGEINEFMGFTFVKTTQCKVSSWGTIPSATYGVSGTDYPAIACTGKAGLFASYIPFRSVVREEENYDYDMVLYGESVIGATRMDTDRIIVIPANASYLATVA